MMQKLPIAVFMVCAITLLFGLGHQNVLAQESELEALKSELESIRATYFTPKLTCYAPPEDVPGYSAEELDKMKLVLCKSVEDFVGFNYIKRDCLSGTARFPSFPTVKDTPECRASVKEYNEKENEYIQEKLRRTEDLEKRIAAKEIEVNDNRVVEKIGNIDAEKRAERKMKLDAFITAHRDNPDFSETLFLIQLLVALDIIQV